MRARSTRHLFALCMVAALVCDCGPSTTSLDPSAAAGPPSAPPATPTPAVATPTPAVTQAPRATSSVAVSSPLPSTGPAAAAPGPTPAPATLPVKARSGYGSATMTPLQGGRLLVVTGARGGDVVAILGRDGRPVAGWPLRLAGRTDCSADVAARDGSIYVLCGEWERDAIVYRLDARGGLLSGWPVTLPDGYCWYGLMAAQDGSIRVFCERRSGEGDAPDHIAFAFDSAGAALPGWPVVLPLAVWESDWGVEPRLVGDRLLLGSSEWVRASKVWEAWLVEVDRGGAIRTGRRVASEDEWELGTIGPDGVLYFANDQVTAIDLDGRRPGWPVVVAGHASFPAFGADDRAYVVTGQSHRGGVLAIDPASASIVAKSPRLRIMTADLGWDCVGGPPGAPALAADGTVFVWKSNQRAIYALEPTLEVRDGWPYQQPKGSPPDECAGADGLCCDTSLDTARAVGADGSLYLALQRRSSKVGGRIIALDRNGRVRDGWPVELRQPGSMFTAIALGADGTVYALATESEGRSKTSATILAIAPDSTVRYRKVVANP